MQLFERTTVVKALAGFAALQTVLLVLMFSNMTPPASQATVCEDKPAAGSGTQVVAPPPSGDTTQCPEAFCPGDSIDVKFGKKTQVEVGECRWMNQGLYEFSPSGTTMDASWLADRWEKWEQLLKIAAKENCVPYIVCGRTLCMLKEGHMCNTDYDIDIKYMCETKADQEAHENKLKKISYSHGYDYLSDRFWYPDPVNFDKLCVCRIQGYNFLCHDDAFLDMQHRYGTTWYIPLPMAKGFLTKTDRPDTWDSLPKAKFTKYACGFLDTLVGFDLNSNGLIDPDEVEARLSKEEMKYFANSVIDTSRLLSWTYIWICNHEGIRRMDYWEKVDVDIVADMDKLKAQAKTCHADNPKKTPNLAKYA